MPRYFGRIRATGRTGATGRSPATGRIRAGHAGLVGVAAFAITLIVPGATALLRAGPQPLSAVPLVRAGADPDTDGGYHARPVPLSDSWRAALDTPIVASPAVGVAGPATPPAEGVDGPATPPTEGVDGPATPPTEGDAGQDVPPAEGDAGRAIAPAGHRITVAAVGDDGRSVLVEDRSATTDRLMLLGGSGGGTPVAALPASTAPRVLGAGCDGRYVAYTLRESATDPDAWSLWLWDAHHPGSPHRIARSAVDATGRPVPGPPNIPILDRGRLIWVQAEPDGTTDVRMYEPTGGRMTVLRRGHPGTPVRADGMLIWAELHGSGHRTKLSALSLTTLHPVALPPALRAVTGPESLAGTGTAVAWTQDGALDIWRPDRPPLRVDWNALPATPTADGTSRPTMPSADDAAGPATPTAGVPAGTGLHLAGPLAAWSDAGGAWVLDLRTGGYAKVAAAGTPVTAAGNRLAVGDAVLDAATLPMLS